MTPPRLDCLARTERFARRFAAAVLPRRKIENAGPGFHRVRGLLLCGPTLAFGEFDEFLEITDLALARPKEPDRSRYAQVRNRDLLDPRYFEMGGHKCQTYPDRNESKHPIIAAAGPAHDAYPYAPGDECIRHVLQNSAAF